MAKGKEKVFNVSLFYNYFPFLVHLDVLWLVKTKHLENNCQEISSMVMALQQPLATDWLHYPVLGTLTTLKV